MAEEKCVSDVLIIGGGHAGLSAALTLYRALHTAVIFDTHEPRNWHSTPIHLLPTWEHQDPEECRQASKAELLKTGLTRFVDVGVVGVEKMIGGLFEVTDAQGRCWKGRKILLAIGMEEIFPNVEGYERCYTRGIFPCMFQFGYEQRGISSAGLLALDGLANAFTATKLADDAHKFTDTLTIYTNSNPALASEVIRFLETSDIQVDDRRIIRLVQGPINSEVTIVFVNGESKTEGFLVHRPLTRLNRKLGNQLELEFGSMGEIKVTPPFCQTNVSGVFAAGDCASPMKIIPNAIAMGAYAGAGLARELPKRITRNYTKYVAEQNDTASCSDGC